MKSQQLSFDYNGSSVITFMTEGQIWFGATSVASALGYRRARSAVDVHCKHTRLFSQKELASLCVFINSPRGIIAIPEGDMYRLVTHSKLPSAQDFELKVYDEILPELRAKGHVTISHELTSAVAALSQEMKVLRVTSEAHNRLCNSEGSFSLTEAAMMNKIGQQELIRLLRDWNWIYKRGKNTAWLPYSDKQKSGFVVVRTHVIDHAGNKPFSVPQVRITSRGLSEISHRLSYILA